MKRLQTGTTRAIVSHAHCRKYRKNKAGKTERVGFEPTVRETRTPVFETGPFNRSGTSPQSCSVTRRDPTPQATRHPPRLPERSQPRTRPPFSPKPRHVRALEGRDPVPGPRRIPRRRLMPAAALPVPRLRPMEGRRRVAQAPHRPAPLGQDAAATGRIAAGRRPGGAQQVP